MIRPDKAADPVVAKVRTMLDAIPAFRSNLTCFRDARGPSFEYRGHGVAGFTPGPKGQAIVKINRDLYAFPEGIDGRFFELYDVLMRAFKETFKRGSTTVDLVKAGFRRVRYTDKVSKTDSTIDFLTATFKDKPGIAIVSGQDDVTFTVADKDRVRSARVIFHDTNAEFVATIEKPGSKMVKTKFFDLGWELQNTLVGYVQNTLFPKRLSEDTLSSAVPSMPLPLGAQLKKFNLKTAMKVRTLRFPEHYTVDMVRKSLATKGCDIHDISECEAA